MTQLFEPVELYLRADNNFYLYRVFDNIALTISPNSKDSTIVETKWKIYSLDLGLPLDIKDLYLKDWGIHFTINETYYKLQKCLLEKITFGPDINGVNRLVFQGSSNLPEIRR